MTELIVTSIRYTLQMFLSDDGVHAVSTDEQHRDLQCDCSMYLKRRMCKHVRLVSRRIRENGGRYPIMTTTRVRDSDIRKSRKSPQDFHRFVVKYAKVEVL